MRLSIETNKIKKAARGLKLSTRDIKAQLSSALESLAIETIGKMKKNHKFKNRTGTLESAMKYKLSKRDLSVEIFLDPSKITVAGYNYGIIMNDGLGRGYKRGKYSEVGGTKGTRFYKGDHWFDKAVDSVIVKKFPVIARKIMMTAVSDGLKKG
jgi:hypothetical protein